MVSCNKNAKGDKERFLNSVALCMNSSVGQPFRICHITCGRNITILIMPPTYIQGDFNIPHRFVMMRERSTENPRTRNVYLFKSPMPNRTPSVIHF